MAKPKRKEEEFQEEVAEDKFQLPETLVGDLRDVILDTIKHEKENKAWAQMSEKEQGDLINRATSAAETFTRQAVHVIASQGFETTAAAMDNWKVKEGEITITLKTVATQKNILSLAGVSKGLVTLTFANDEDFDRNRTELKPDPDQPELVGQAHD